MSLSAPFVTLTGDPWDLAPLGGTIVLSAADHFPDEPRGLETPSWPDMFTRYSIDHPGGSDSLIAFRAPSHGRFGVVNRDPRRLGVFLPLTLGPWAFASDGATWPQPHGNALVVNLDHLDPDDVEERISILVYQRILDGDPIRYLRPVAGGGEDEYDVDQVVADMADLPDEGDPDRPREAEALATARATVDEASDLLLPLTEGALLPLKSGDDDGVEVDLAAAHVETESGDIRTGEPWTWVDVDAVFHYLDDAGAFGPALELGPGREDETVRMWRENDELPDDRVRVARVGDTELHEPPAGGSVSEDVLSIREPTEFTSKFESDPDPLEWTVELLDHRDPGTVLRTVSQPGSGTLTMGPFRQSDADAAETSVRVGVEDEPGATYRNFPSGIQQVWMWGLGLSTSRESYERWRADVLELRPTDLILILPHTAISQINPDDASYDLEEGSREDIAYIAQDLFEWDIRPHLALYLVPFEEWLRDTGEQVSQIVEQAGRDDSDDPIIGSVVFDLERPWNDPEAEHRFDIDADADPIRTPSLEEYQRLVHSVLLPSYRSVTDRGTQLRATEQGNVATERGNNDRRQRSETVFEVCDTLFPQAYTSGTTTTVDGEEVYIHSTNPGPHQDRRIRQWANRYDKQLVVTLTLQNQDEIPGIEGVEDAIRPAVGACSRWTPNPVDGIAFWSMDQATGEKEDIVESICQDARAAGVMEDS